MKGEHDSFRAPQRSIIRERGPNTFKRGVEVRKNGGTVSNIAAGMGSHKGFPLDLETQSTENFPGAPPLDPANKKIF